MKLNKNDKKAIRVLFDEQNGYSAYILRVEMKNMFPKIFKEDVNLEVGKWYKHNNNECFYYVTQIKSDESYYAYGLDCDGEWKDNKMFGLVTDDLLKKVNEATHEEIQCVLIKEAKKRGFKKGVKYNYPCSLYIPKREITGDFKFCEISNDLYDDYKTIFENGIWIAKPIFTITKKEAEKKLNLKIID